MTKRVTMAAWRPARTSAATISRMKSARSAGGDVSMVTGAAIQDEVGWNWLASLPPREPVPQPAESSRT